MAPRSRLCFAALVWIAATLLAACGGGGTPPGVTGNSSTVYAGDPIAPGAECAFGGVRIYYGIDENGNGQLDDDERDGYEVVCNGAGSGANPVTPPASPAAAYTLKAVGGGALGTGGDGAAGGSLTLALSSSGTGHIKLFTTGQADASFDFPASASNYLGSLPLLVETDTTVPSFNTAAGHPPTGLSYGAPHTHVGDPAIYRTNGTGDGDDGTFTGISVAPGVTLTFELQDCCEVSVTVPNDIRNEGTITVVKSDGFSSGSLYIECDTFYGATDSQILVNGLADADTGQAGNGGSLSIRAYSESLGFPPYQGALYNRGLIDASGADSFDSNYAGSGGWVTLRANLALLNTGDIHTSGGDSADYHAGWGGPIVLDGYGGDGEYHARVFNSGNLDSHGGTGFSSGGDSGFVEITSRGDLRNSGHIRAWGGDGTDPEGADGGGTGYAGEGSSDYRLTAYGGSVINSGDILIHAGNYIADFSLGGVQSLFIETYGDSGFWSNLPAGGIVLSGTIDVSGGSNSDATWGGGYDGGAAGSVSLSVDAAGTPNGQEIQLLGYSSIDLSGGAGADNGGAAGNLYAGNHNVTGNTGSGNDWVTGPAGGIYNYVPVTANGGSGDPTLYTGGAGGAFELLVDADHPSLAPWQIAANYAAVSLNGGDGNTGGNSGSVAIVAPSGAQNHGNLTLNPGLSEGTSGAGHGVSPNFGSAGVYILAGLGPAVNSATITANGGTSGLSACSNGSDGNLVQISGTLAVHTGPLISVRGGDAEECEDVPGAGGVVYLWSRAGVSTVTGSFDIIGGGYLDDEPDEGPGLGDPGWVLIDGINRTEDYLP
jgi:hypothetical protein